MKLRRLYPEPGELTLAEATSGLALEERAPRDRPYVFCNMVSTADGKAVIAGRAGPVGNETDQALFRRLRTQADAVLVGTQTLRVERYGRLVRDEELHQQREREGRAPDPLACVITRSGDVPFDIPMLADPEQPAVVYTSADPEGDVPAHVAVERVTDEELTPAAIARRLRRDHGVRTLLCEGGPALNHSLLADGVLDMLFLSVAAKIAGGVDALTIVAGMPFDAPVGLRLESAIESESYLYLRYAVE